MKILTLNCGSSSIKYKLFVIEEREKVKACGLIESISEKQGHLKHVEYDDNNNVIKQIKKNQSFKNHEEGLQLIADLLGSIVKNNEIDAIGHRIVHGGPLFNRSVIIDDKVLKSIADCISLAPLHNRAHLKGIKIAQKIFKKSLQIAIFDTAFHATLPDFAYRYAIPNKYFNDYKIRRYGFHGTSHAYVAKTACEFLKCELKKTKIISMHLGNGASLCAILNGKSIDTSMGMTPLAGLMMGTRSGDLDPAILTYIAKEEGLNLEEIDNLLNRESGFKGICQENDMRKVEEKVKTGDPASKLALAIYIYRIKKYIGAYIAILGGIDIIIFTAGIGENSDLVRYLVCTGLSHLGIQISADKNMQIELGDKIEEISDNSSLVKILIVPTNEELQMVKEILMLI